MRSGTFEMIELIKKNSSVLGKKRITIGFDGYVDEIVRPVKLKEIGNISYYNTIAEFSHRIMNSKDSACEIEIIPDMIKLGGNAPLMANATANLGIKTSVIGAFGFPQLNPYFKELAEKLDLYSIADPAKTNALEFHDGKIMFGNNDNLNKVNWENIKSIIGIERLTSLIEESHIFSAVNWSSLYHLDGILKGIKQDIVDKSKSLSPDVNYAFFDLADPTKRSSSEIDAGLNIMCSFRNKYRLVFSFNENEAKRINRYYFDDTDDIFRIAENLYGLLNPHILILRPNQFAILLEDGKITTTDGFHVEKPRLSTGGGDNFDAGFCTGLLMGLPSETSLYMARACASYYIKYGNSPSLTELLNYMENE